MSDIQKFRKSMNGFNRHDVVTYIEYLNNKHNAQVIQLNNQLAAALAAPKADEVVKGQLEAEKAQLQEQVNALQAENQNLQDLLANTQEPQPLDETAVLKAENASLQARVGALQAECAARSAMPVVANDDSEKRIQALQSDYELRLALMKKDYESQIAALQAELATRSSSMTSCTEQELEAYRRAERVERLAMERARQTRQQATGIIAEASSKVQAAAQQLEDAAQNIAQQLDIYKTTVMDASQVLTGTASALETIAPDEE